MPFATPSRQVRCRRPSGDENGPVKIVVDGYNGDFSNDAYTLRVKVITPPQLPACPARSFPFPAGAVGTLPATIPADTGAMIPKLAIY